MDSKWTVESDGGGWWEGNHHVVQPKTWYVVNGGDRIDCDSRREAVALAKRLNAGEGDRIAREYARNENMSPENPGWI